MTRIDTFLSLAVNSWINGNRVVWPGADLRGADMGGADLRFAVLRGAVLRFADFTDADLSGAKVAIGNRTFTLAEENDR